MNKRVRRKKLCLICLDLGHQAKICSFSKGLSSQVRLDPQKHNGNIFSQGNPHVPPYYINSNTILMENQAGYNQGWGGTSNDANQPRPLPPPNPKIPNANFNQGRTTPRS